LTGIYTPSEESGPFAEEERDVVSRREEVPRKAALQKMSGAPLDKEKKSRVRPACGRGERVQSYLQEKGEGKATYRCISEIGRQRETRPSEGKAWRHPLPKRGEGDSAGARFWKESHITSELNSGKGTVFAFCGRGEEEESTNVLLSGETKKEEKGATSHEQRYIYLEKKNKEKFPPGGGKGKVNI